MTYQLIATVLANDPRVLQAKQLLQCALEEHRKNISGVKSPSISLKIHYDKLIATLNQERGNALWFPYLGSGMGNGPFVELADGSIKFDFICGIGVHSWGHNHPDLLPVGIDAALSNTVMQGNLQQNVDSAELSSLFLKIAQLDHCFLSSSGALANENALKIAFQKNDPATRILAFERCFAGRTLIQAYITDKPMFRDGLPKRCEVDYIPFFSSNDSEGSIKRAVEALKTAIRHYPKQHAVMCFELVQGEAGCYGAPREFFVPLMQILKEHHIAVFVDEIQSFGRTSQPFAYQHLDLHSYIDIVTVGKLSQVCATLFTKEYNPRPLLLGHTFTSSTAAIKAGLIILKDILSGDLFGPEGRIMRLHCYFAQKLQELSARYPEIIEGPFGVGTMMAFTSYQGDQKKTQAFVRRLFDAGVITFTGGGGAHPTRVRLLIPAKVITEKEIDKVIQIIESVI